MKVVDLIDKLTQIGFDKNTEITFSTDNSFGEIYDLTIEDFFYGDDLAIPNINEIDISFCIPKKYIESEKNNTIEELKEDIQNVLYRYSK